MTRSHPRLLLDYCLALDRIDAPVAAGDRYGRMFDLPALDVADWLLAPLGEVGGPCDGDEDAGGAAGGRLAHLRPVCRARPDRRPLAPARPRRPRHVAKHASAAGQFRFALWRPGRRALSPARLPVRSVSAAIEIRTVMGSLPPPFRRQHIVGRFATQEPCTSYIAIPCYADADAHMADAMTMPESQTTPRTTWSWPASTGASL